MDKSKVSREISVVFFIDLYCKYGYYSRRSVKEKIEMKGKSRKGKENVYVFQ
jgi:hypothetical protein